MIAAAAAMAASSAFASSKAQEAKGHALAGALDQQTTMNEQARQEALARQRALEGQAGAAVNAQIDNQGADAQQAQQDSAVGARLAQYQAATQPSGPLADYLPTTAGAPSVVQDQLVSSIGGALDRAKTMNAAKAKLTGMGDLQLGNEIALGQTGQNVNLFNNFRQGERGVYTTRLNANQTRFQAGQMAAQNAGKEWEMAGQILGLGSKLGAAYAGSQAGGGAGFSGAGGAGMAAPGTSAFSGTGGIY